MLDRLATLAPILMSGMGKRQNTLDRVLDIQDYNRQADEKERVKLAMRDIMTMASQDPQGMTAESIMGVAQKHNAPFMPLFQTLSTFQKWNSQFAEKPQTASKILENDGRVLEREVLPSIFEQTGMGDSGWLLGKISGSRTPDPKVVAADGTYATYNRETGRMEPIPGARPTQKNGISVQTGPSGTIMRIGGSGAGGFNDWPGQATSAPKTKSVNEAQFGIGKGMDYIQRLENIEKNFDPEFLTYGGQLKDYALSKAEKLGIPISQANQKYLGDFTKLSQQVGQLWNQYRVEITGVAASEKELKTLKKTFLNMNLSPTQFKAALDNVKQDMKRGIRLKQKLLRSGIPVGTPEFEKKWEMLFNAGFDDDIDEMGDYLQQQNGWSDERTAQELEKMGYL
jgi:hypothetical protein